MRVNNNNMKLSDYIEKGNSIKNLKPNQLKLSLSEYENRVIEEIREVIKENGYILKFRFEGEEFYRRVNSEWVEVGV